MKFKKPDGKDEIVHGHYRGEVITFCGISISDWIEVRDDNTDIIDCSKCRWNSQAVTHNNRVRSQDKLKKA